MDSEQHRSADRPAKPRVSIGIPVYNGEAFVEGAINAALAQTYTDFELVISDNASTDRTEEICREFARRDARVKYVRAEQNQGAIWNFNRVFELSQGEYFKWAAADDLFLPTFLEKCAQVLDDNPSVIWCHTQSGKIDQYDQPLSVDDPASDGAVHSSDDGLPRDFHQSPHRHERFRGVLLGTTWSADSYGLIRADALRQTCMLISCYGAEKVLIGALSLIGQYAEIPETLFYQRIHSSTASNLNTASQQQAYMDTQAKSRVALTRLRLLLGHFESVLHAKMSLLDRVMCFWEIAHYVFQVRKWMRIVAGTMKGAGLGKEGTVTPRSTKNAL